MRTSRWLISAFMALLPGVGSTLADEIKPLTAEQINRLHQMIKPRPGESRWMEIDWHPSVWEGRQIAAKEGKPLFIWAGSGGAPAAGC